MERTQVLCPDTVKVGDEGGEEEDTLAAKETKDEEFNEDGVNGVTAAESVSGTLMVRRDETKDKESNMDTVDGGTAADQTGTSTERRAWGG